MRLLERELQLGALHDYAADARGGDGRLVLVSGEAGIGKSSLVDAFLEDLTDVRVAWSACDGAFTPSALGPLQDVADQWGGAVRVACADGVPRDTRFAALLSMLREHGDQGGLSVLVVEDLHFADEATLDLVGHLARRLRAVRALVVATYRDDGLAENRALRETLGEASTLRSTRRISLPRLTPDAVTRLSLGSGREPAALHALTGGNPFFVSEVLCATSDELPASARDAVLARASRLSAAGRAVLDAAALVGERVEPDLLAAVTGAEVGRPRRARRRRTPRRRRFGAALPPRDRPPGRGAGGRPVGGRRGAPSHPCRAGRRRRRRRRPPGPPRRGRARRTGDRALRHECGRPFGGAGVPARGRGAVPPCAPVRAARAAAGAGRPAGQARPPAGPARPVGGGGRGAGGVHRALAGPGRLAPGG